MLQSTLLQMVHRHLLISPTRHSVRHLICAREKLSLVKARISRGQRKAQKTSRFSKRGGASCRILISRYVSCLFDVICWAVCLNMFDDRMPISMNCVPSLQRRLGVTGQRWFWSPRASISYLKSLRRCSHRYRRNNRDPSIRVRSHHRLLGGRGLFILSCLFLLSSLAQVYHRAHFNVFALPAV